MTKSSKRLELGRKPANRKKGKRHLIVTNGKVTETAYFKHLIAESGVRGRVLVRTIEGDPLTVAKAINKELASDKGAVTKKQGIDELSTVWLVVDADDFKNLRNTETELRKSGAQLCLSNPCFEVWLIDHFELCSDSLSVAKLCEERARKLGATKPTNSRRQSLAKCKDINVEALKGKEDAACKNARRHNTDEKKTIRTNRPDEKNLYAVWTDMPDLVKTVFGLSS